LEGLEVLEGLKELEELLELEELKEVEELKELLRRTAVRLNNVRLNNVRLNVRTNHPDLVIPGFPENLGQFHHLLAGLNRQLIQKLMTISTNINWISRNTIETIIFSNLIITTILSATTRNTKG